ncbi:hypothetical protein VTL71DRAFT_4103 [Oculimacula yallundae]|uniref:Uncharacterized protein n=1 Tax=Oculimacula yallundae TaxID=86028 RepID=A0ABR4C4V8_9HELO
MNSLNLNIRRFGPVVRKSLTVEESALESALRASTRTVEGLQDIEPKYLGRGRAASKDRRFKRNEVLDDPWYPKEDCSVIWEGGGRDPKVVDTARLYQMHQYRGRRQASKVVEERKEDVEAVKSDRQTDQDLHAATVEAQGTAEARKDNWLTGRPKLK